MFISSPFDPSLYCSSIYKHFVFPTWLPNPNFLYTSCSPHKIHMSHYAFLNLMNPTILHEAPYYVTNFITSYQSNSSMSTNVSACHQQSTILSLSVFSTVLCSDNILHTKQKSQYTCKSDCQVAMVTDFPLF